MFSFSCIICGYRRAMCAARKYCVAFNIQGEIISPFLDELQTIRVQPTLSSFKRHGKKTQLPLTMSDLSQTSVYTAEISHCTSVWVYCDGELMFVEQGQQCMLILTHDVNSAGWHSIRSSYTRMENDVLVWRGFNGIKSMCRQLVHTQFLL